MPASVPVILFWFLGGSLAGAQRLPKIAAPSNYNLHFRPDINGGVFSGEETIQIQVLQPTKTIVLNAVDLQFLDTTITAESKTQKAAVTADPENQTVTLEFGQQVPLGAATLSIRFEGVLNKQLRGFYLSRGANRSYAVTQFEATDARRAFPSFDEPSYKATFDIALTIDRQDTAISNGHIVSDKPAGAKHTLVFSTSPKMSSYLVAMAIGDWQCSQGETDGIPIRVCAVPSKLPLTHFALEAAEHILSFYDRYYSMKYPYGKLDMLAFPDFEAGAMENTAAIFYRESDLLVSDTTGSINAHRNAAETIAHEMAHQWFGDLVTMQWWDNIWLNEGFATWMTSKPLDDWRPDWQDGLRDALNNAVSMNIDARKNTRPIRQQAETPEQIDELFDGIAYGKAAAVLRMAEAYVGPDTFRQGVNQYLARYAYGNATAEDFWNVIAAVSGRPVDRIMSSFVEQPGVPLVSAQATCNENSWSVSLRQQRFLEASSAFGSQPEELWNIPVCMKLETGDDRRCVVADRKSATVNPGLNGCSSSFFANAGGTGYYRTQYSPDALAKIPFPRLSGAERILFLSDLWALTVANQVPIGSYLSEVMDLSDERKAPVIEITLAPLNTISDYLATDADRAAYERYLQAVFGDLGERLGLRTDPGDSDAINSLRPEIISLLGRTGNNVKIAQEARQEVERYLKDSSAADRNTGGVVLRLAARKGDAGLFDRYWQAAKRAGTPEEYNSWFTALTAFTDPALVKRTLDLSLSSEVRSSDVMFLVDGELSNPLTQDTAWNWLKTNWTATARKETIEGGEGLVRSLGSFCDPNHEEDIKQFFASHKIQASERTLHEAEEKIDACIELRKTQQAPLEKWLESWK